MVATNLLFDSLDMTTAEPLHITSQLKIFLNLRVIQNAKAVNDRERLAHHLKNFFRIKLKIRLMPNGQNDGIGTFHNLSEVLEDAKITEFLLIPKVIRSMLAVGWDPCRQNGISLSLSHWLPF